MSKESLKKIKSDLLLQVKLMTDRSFDEAYAVGMSEDAEKYKSELAEAIAKAQEAYAWVQVVLNRISHVTHNDWDQTTVSYIRSARKELLSINGVSESN